VELTGEDLAKRRVLAPPADPDRTFLYVGLFVLIRDSAFAPPARESP